MTDKPEIDPTLPELVRNFLASGGQLEEIRLDAAGDWWHKGGLFNNLKMMRLFSRSVDRTEGGTWVLRVGRFTYPIEVDDTGFFVERVTFQGEPGEAQATLHLSDETEEALDPATLRYQEGRGFYATIKQGRFEAHFKRPAYYAFMDLLDEEGGHYVLRLGGQAWSLSPK